MSRACRAGGCTRPVAARGFCGTHYSRWKRTGTTDGPPLPNSRPLTRTQLQQLRRLVGLPDDGPTAEQTARWDREERSRPGRKDAA